MRAVCFPCRTAFAGFIKLAEQGHASAQYNLGVMYAKSQGAPKDEQQAVTWFRKAAEQGDGPAQFNLGVMYALGQGVPKDEQSAYFFLGCHPRNGVESTGRRVGHHPANRLVRVGLCRQHEPAPFPSGVR